MRQPVQCKHSTAQTKNGAGAEAVPAYDSPNLTPRPVEILDLELLPGAELGALNARCIDWMGQLLQGRTKR